MYSTLKHTFWCEKFWLPSKFHWKDLESVNRHKVQDVFYYIPLIACCILILRHVVKKQLSVPLGKFLGLKEKIGRNFGSNAVLEKEFQLSGMALLKDHDKLQILAKKGLGDVRQIERWLRNRISQEKPSKLKKFGESHWKLMWYSFTSFYGFYILWDQPWFWDANLCFDNYPLQNVPTTIIWYYIVSCSFSLTLLITQFYLPKNKDFWQLMIHHLATLLLLTMSYISNFVRIGSLVLLIHDVGDVFLQFCKICIYTKKSKMHSISFILFTLVWIVSRLMVFPYLIYTCIFGPRTFKIFPTMSILIGMLIVLQILHFIWSFYIYKILMNAISKGNGKIRDMRSSSESSD